MPNPGNRSLTRHSRNQTGTGTGYHSSEVEDGAGLLTERHGQQIAGGLSCYDRVIVPGTLPVFCYAEGMTASLTKRRIRIFEFTQFAKPRTDTIKANAEQLAAANGLTIDYVRKKNFRKEDRDKGVLKERGTHPGLVWIFSALEPCTTYQPWRDKTSGRTHLRYDDGKELQSERAPGRVAKP